jgi:hypothetical protein
LPEAIARPQCSVVSDGVTTVGLLDTGCNPGSCIDRVFLAKLIKARLKQGKEPLTCDDCNVCMTMADATSKQQITKKYFIEFELSRTGFESMSFGDWYFPADLSVEVIIGYDALIGPVFQFAMSIYQFQHETWLSMQQVHGVDPDAMCNMIGNMDTCFEKAEDTQQQSMGIPGQDLYPQLRLLSDANINKQFKQQRIKGHAIYQVFSNAMGLGVRLGHKAKALNAYQVLFTQDCLPPMPTADFDDNRHVLYEDYAFGTDEHVMVPDSAKTGYVFMINDLLDDGAYNCKMRKVRGKHQVEVVADRDIEPGAILSLPYGIDWWCRWLCQQHRHMDTAEWQSLLAKASLVYSGLQTRVVKALHLMATEAHSFMMNHMNINPIEGEIYNPFAEAHIEGIEDQQIPDPASIPDELLPGGEIGSLMADYDVRKEKYLNGLEAQVDPAFMSDDLMTFLRSEECMDVFVPKKWIGLVDPVTKEPLVHTIRWFEKPPVKKFPMIRVRPEISGKAKKEADHLLYIMFWVASSSPLASSMLIAPKATDPFIRIVTNYAWMKGYMMVPKHPLVHVKDSLAFMKRGDPLTGKPFQLFCDLDMLASFHQLLIDEDSSECLSVVTPWGQYRPRFLPEGIPPATAMLQAAVDRVFSGCKDRLLTIYDNLLLGGTSKEDMLVQLKRVIGVCRSNNMLLKLTKCWFGAKQVKFFGYICDNEKYYLEQSRVESVQAITFPGDAGKSRAAKVKYMQRYLGMGNFFSGFIPEYAVLTAPLTDMIHDSFDWSQTSSPDNQWRTAFDTHKALIAASFELFHPDYDLDWVLRVDASSLGIGGVLFQKAKNGQLQPLHMFSQKFDVTGRKWHVMHQEAFAIFRCMQVMQGMLRGKQFLLQTDHRNLLWMEKSQNDKIIRMGQFMHSFLFVVEHIPGRINIVADMMSRWFPESDHIDTAHIVLELIDDDEGAFGGFSPLYFDECELADCTEQQLNHIDQVHGGTHGHPGWMRTWAKLNKYFPGHGYSVAQVRSFIDECAVCQKTRLRTSEYTIIPIPKHLPVRHPRFMIAMDGTKVITSALGNTYILVIYNLFTKHVVLYPMSDKTAVRCASTVYKYFSMFGLCDVVHTDLGSDFNSVAMRDLLHNWLGPQQSFALTGNPQADGVEPVVKAVLRHLSALVADGWDRNSWDLDIFLANCMLMLNNETHTTSPVTAIQATFGYADEKYFDFPAMAKVCDTKYVKQLQEQLEVMREITRKYQLDKKPVPKDIDFSQFNRFQPGDLVFLKLDKIQKSDKLVAFNKGPFEVLLHPVGHNHVSVRNLVTDSVDTKFNCQDLQVFFGSREEALVLARQDDQQHLVTAITAHRGDVYKRAEMTFLVQWADGDEQWMLYKPDIIDTEAFEIYCTNHTFILLRLLLMTVTVVNRLTKEANLGGIPAALVNTDFYFNLRSFGGLWYDARHLLPNRDSVTYLVPARICQLVNARGKKVQIQVKILPWTIEVDHFFLQYHCSQTQLRDSDHLLTTAECISWDLHQA